MIGSCWVVGVKVIMVIGDYFFIVEVIVWKINFMFGEIWERVVK